jgi:hypothetical protein
MAVWDGADNNEGDLIMRVHKASLALATITAALAGASVSDSALARNLSSNYRTPPSSGFYWLNRAPSDLAWRNVSTLLP